jgi:hypothetical protein
MQKHFDRNDPILLCGTVSQMLFLTTCIPLKNINPNKEWISSNFCNIMNIKAFCPRLPTGYIRLSLSVEYPA